MNKRRKVSSRSSPWYAEGLRFECQACGNCCTGPPGYVWVNTRELSEIASFLGISLPELVMHFTRSVDGRISLIELAGGDCVFLDPTSRLCRIYPVRPRQCRTWPFWTSNLASRASWAEAAARCPGCNRGRLYTFTEIEEIRLG
ncbi:MAG: YkgJ family cysteine cluster protein [Thermoguttaceae bacterium]|nr:YkgJ family cysteine cluster protein [Thermoguttaceae bacterium]MDW8078680.1 YkgJ family cysteine cluster protein [Thermoguttaceae bacterium]